MNGRLLISAIVSCLLFSTVASAQFREEAFSQSYNDDKTPTDSIDVLFSFKEYFGGLAHKNELKPGTLVAGSAVFLGGCQIYNKQYWKLPIAYSAMFGGLGTGIYFNTKGKQDIAKYCFIGAGVAYWGTLLDGIVSYKADWPKPGKATIYSILVPGLGQIYNREYWKLPIYLGGMAASFHFYKSNQLLYDKYRKIYIQATTDPEYSGPITADIAKYYRDVNRRYRDYSLLALGLVYLLQVIDANIFSYMHDFEVNDDLALTLTPTVIQPQNQIAFSPGGSANAIGLSLGFNF